MNDKIKPMDEAAEKVNDLFQEASVDFANDVKEKYKDEIKAIMERRAKAALVVANIDREISELKLKIAQEIAAS